MYTNRTTDIIIDYDLNILFKIKEIIKNGFEKLKIAVQSKFNSDFKIYYELDSKFNEIALMLEKYEILHEELDYFLLISDKILYIIKKNCENNSFGHYNFALDLFDFFIEIWDAKVDLLKNYSTSQLEKYKNLKDDFNKKYFEFNKKFHMEIFQPDENYCEKEIYRVMKSMRE